MDARSLATRRVMKTVARNATSERPLPVVLDDGSNPIVVALPEDKLTDVGARVERFGGRANVFVTMPDRLTLIDFKVDHDGKVAVEQLAHEQTSMAMYVAFLRMSPGHTAAVQVSLDTEAEASEIREMAYAF